MQSNGKAGHGVRIALVAFLIAVLLSAAVGMVAVARTMEAGPKIGDILVFRPGAQVPLEWEFAAVTHSDQLPVTCKLKPEAMASGGGSLVVEQRSPNRRLYRVHWAGDRTNADATDCGKAADLLLSRVDLQLLSNAVGGPGVERSRFPGF